MAEYTRENYDTYCEQFVTDPAFQGVEPSSYEYWVAFNECIDRLDRDGIFRRIKERRAD